MAVLAYKDLQLLVYTFPHVSEASESLTSGTSHSDHALFLRQK